MRHRSVHKAPAPEPQHSPRATRGLMGAQGGHLGPGTMTPQTSRHHITPLTIRYYPKMCQPFLDLELLTQLKITVRMPMKRQNKFTCVGMHHYKNLKVTGKGDIVAKVHLKGHLIISILKFKPFLVIRICDKVLGYCSCSCSIVCFNQFLNDN